MSLAVHQCLLAFQGDKFQSFNGIAQWSGKNIQPVEPAGKALSPESSSIQTGSTQLADM